MLEFMRERARSWVTFIVVGIIAFMMAITGLETLAPNPNNPEVASVNGEAITQYDLAQAVEQERQLLIQRMGDRFDPAMLDEKVIQTRVLEQLITRDLLLQSAGEQKMGVSDAAIDAYILQMPQFQVNGAFDQQRFQYLLASNGITPLMFRESLEQEMVLQQLRSGIASSEFVTEAEMATIARLEQQTRDIAWVTLSRQQQEKIITVSDEQIQQYYDSHNGRFMTPEQVIAQYVVLDKNSIAQAVKLTEADIEEAYNLRVQELSETANVAAELSVIVINTNDDRNQEAALKRAQEAIAKFNGGTSFVALAKEYSDDAATANSGGKLGVVETGFFGDAFDNAMTALAVGDISAPVTTDNGYQLLYKSQPEVSIPTMAQLRPELEASLKIRRVEDLYLQQARTLADVSFEASDLEQPAQELGLEIITTDAFGRNQGGGGVIGNAQVVAAVFSDDVLGFGANSDVIELSPTQSVVIRVKEHLKPKLLPLADVREQIVATIKTNEAEKAIAKRSAELVAELNGGETLAAVAKANDLSVSSEKAVARNSTEVPRDLVDYAFTMAHPQDGDTYDSATLADGNVAVVALSKVTDGEGDSEYAKNMKPILTMLDGNTSFDVYLKSLRDRAKIKRFAE